MTAEEAPFDTHEGDPLSTSRDLSKLAAALSAAQAEIQAATKDSANPFYNSKYADLQSVWGVCHEPLTKHGLAVSQVCVTTEGGPVLKTVLLHTSGQRIVGDLPIILLDKVVQDKRTGELKTVPAGPQEFGSAMTYMRRYGLQAIVGVVCEDDDGERASGRGAKPAPSEKQQPKKQETPARKPLDIAEASKQLAAAKKPTDAAKVATLAKADFGKTPEWPAFEALAGGRIFSLVEEKINEPKADVAFLTKLSGWLMSCVFVEEEQKAALNKLMAEALAKIEAASGEA